MDLMAEEVVGRNLYDFCHAEDLQKLHKAHLDCKFHFGSRFRYLVTQSITKSWPLNALLSCDCQIFVQQFYDRFRVAGYSVNWRQQSRNFRMIVEAKYSHT